MSNYQYELKEGNGFDKYDRLILGSEYIKGIINGKGIEYNYEGKKNLKVYI